MINTLHLFNSGRSGSKVRLITDSGITGVLKENVKNCDKVVELMQTSQLNTPEIYWHTEDSIFMQYIPGQTMRDFFVHASRQELNLLIETLRDYINTAIGNSIAYDFSNEIKNKKNTLRPYYDIDSITFDTVLPKSTIHGDLTFDNMIYYNKKFYFIDFNPTDLNSIFFDINKLRQDLDGYWFLRNSRSQTTCIKMQLLYVKKHLRCSYPTAFDNSIYKFMLCRMLPYITDNEKSFILEEVKNYESYYSMRWTK